MITSDFLIAGTRDQQRDLTQAQALVTSVWYQVFGGDVDAAPRKATPDAFTSQALERDSKCAAPFPLCTFASLYLGTFASLYPCLVVTVPLCICYLYIYLFYLVPKQTL